MTPCSKFLLREIGLYYLKAAVFAAVGYLLFLAIYGGMRISFFSWVLVILAAFTIAYIPVLVRAVRAARGIKSEGNKREGAP